MTFRPPCWLLAAGLLCGLSARSAASSAPVAFIQLEETTLEVVPLVPGLNSPIDLEIGPDGFLWLTQLEGPVWRIDPTTGNHQEVLRVEGIFHRRSHGLLSLALHPQFEQEPWVYLHYVYQVPSKTNDEIVRSRVVRSRWNGERLEPPETVFDDIPGRSYHNGSRLVFGPDGKLYVTTGDAGEPRHSLDPQQLSGKVLRLNPDGTIPGDNPTPGSPVWTLGHRNPQGLVFAPNGRVYLSDHGATTDDEVNLLEPRRNYGWPVIQGFIDRPEEKTAAQRQTFTEPLHAWSPTIAASGLAYYDHPAIPEWRNSLLLASLKGRSLRILELNTTGEQVVRERIFLQQHLGRLREVCVGPDGEIYLVTSNTDWHPRFQPWMYDHLPEGPDRILRLRPADQTQVARLAVKENVPVWREDLEPMALMSEEWTQPPTTEALRAGQDLYMLHCAACHRPDGTGAPGLIPPLTNTEWVRNKYRFVQVVLTGLSGRIEVNGESYDQEMPGFSHLPDEELAALLTYVRASFGNRADAVSVNEVIEERKGMR